MRRNLLVWALIAATLAIAGCNWGTIRGCQRVRGTTVNEFDLDYVAVIPSNCPVPLGVVGEMKFAGAEIRDNGSIDAAFGETIVTNSNSALVGHDIDSFLEVGWCGCREAIAIARYAAATAFNSNTGGGATDYGLFTVILEPGVFGQRPFAEIAITYQSTGMRVAVQGPDVPTGNSTGTWDAPVTGGSAPYSYGWYRDGQLVGTASSYTGNVGTYEFGLRVEVTDQTTASRWADYWVQVDGVRVAISGPLITYYSEGGSTWTATGRGGYEPYAFEWYIDNGWDAPDFVGSGSTWSGYPGEGDQRLRVVMTDARGAKHDEYKTVKGIGNDQCAPVPPAITCF